MAEGTVSKIYDIQVQGSEALKTLAELRLRSQELKEEQKQLGPVTEQNAEQYYKLDSQIKAINKEAAAYQKQITSSIKFQNEQEHSLERLKTQLSLDTAELSKLGNATKDAARKSELQDRIAATSAELKKQEEILGDHHRSVGDYGKAAMSLRGELRQLTEQLTQMRLAGQENTPAFQEMTQRASEVRDAMDDTRQSIGGLASDTSNIDALSQGVSGLAGAFGVYNSLIGVTLGENDELANVMKNLQVVMAALVSLTAIKNALEKQSIVYSKARSIVEAIGLNQTLAQTKALAAKNAMLGATTIGTKLAAAATWLWNAALAANPVVLIALAIAALVAGVVLLTQTFGKSAQAQRESKKAMEEYEAQSSKTEQTIDRVGKAQADQTAQAQLNSAKQIEAAKQRGASEQDIAELELDLIEEVARIDTEAANERIAANQSLVPELEDAIRAKEKELSTYDEGTKKFKEASEALAELKGRYDDLNVSINEDGRLIEQSSLNVLTKQRENNAKAVQSARDGAKKALDAYLKASQSRQKLEEETLKSQNVFQSDDLKTRQKYESDLFEIQQRGEKERLAQRLKSRDITAKEYNNEYRLLTLQSEQFYDKQQADLNKYFEDMRNGVLAAAGQDVEAQIAEVVTEYNEAIKSLDTIEAPVRVAGMTDDEYQTALDKHEEFLFNRAELETRLEEKKDADIQAIRDNSLAARVAKIDTVLEKEYKDDFDRYADNEAEKLRVTIEMLNKRITALKAAGASTLAEETALRAAEAQQNAINLERQLRDRSLSAKERHALTKQSLQADLELYEGNADKQAEIMAQMAENDRQLAEARIQNFTDYSSAMGDMLGALNDLFAAMDEAEMQRIEEKYAKQQADLDSKLDKGLISQEDYDKEKTKLEKAQSKEENKIKREQAIRDRIASLFSIAINTATGIMGAVASFPLTGGLPWSAIVAAIGGIQAAAVLAAPLPKAARGQYVRGASHATGGVQMEVEGGEAIINKRSTSMFLPLLSAINEMGGGIPFTTPGADGGYSLRSAMLQGGGITKADISDAMQEAVSQVTVVATIEDIRRGDANYIQVENRGNIIE